MPIYVFNLALAVHQSKHHTDRLWLPALGFSGVAGFEDLPKILPLARRYFSRQFVTHYPHKELIVIAPQPHFDDEHQNARTFRQLYDVRFERMITRTDLIIKCPSLAKFNDCYTCSTTFGSLICFARCLPEIANKSTEKNCLSLDHLYNYYQGSPAVMPRKRLGADFHWTAPSHVTTYRRRSCQAVDTVARVVSSASQIEKSIRRYAQAAKQGRETESLIKIRCSQCCFDDYCTYRRWRLRQCPADGYKKEDLIQRAMETIQQNLDARVMSRDQLESFVNAGGHSICPWGFEMIFRGLNHTFDQGIFSSGQGRRFWSFDIPSTLHLLRARFWTGSGYTKPAWRNTPQPVTDEMLAIYYELSKQGYYKTSDGWSQHSRIRSLSVYADAIEMSFFSSRWTTSIKNYASLYNHLPRWISTI